MRRYRRSCSKGALSDIVKVTYNCLSIDGDTSTNDMIILQANGLAGNGKLVSEDQDFEVFKGAVCCDA